MFDLVVFAEFEQRADAGARRQEPEKVFQRDEENEISGEFFKRPGGGHPAGGDQFRDAEEGQRQHNSEQTAERRVGEQVGAQDEHPQCGEAKGQNGCGKRMHAEQQGAAKKNRADGKRDIAEAKMWPVLRPRLQGFFQQHFVAGRDCAGEEKAEHKILDPDQGAGDRCWMPPVRDIDELRQHPADAEQDRDFQHLCPEVRTQKVEGCPAGAHCQRANQIAKVVAFTHVVFA